MVESCFICSKEYTLSLLAEGNYFTQVEDTLYCADCFDNLENSIIYCARCCQFEHKNTNFDKLFVESIDCDRNVVYYHIQCLFETETCPICKDYLKKEECIDVFVDSNHKRKYHQSCVENNNGVEICHECGISLRVKCESCNRRFTDCYNDDCNAHAAYDDNNRYDGNCGYCNG